MCDPEETVAGCHSAEHENQLVGIGQHTGAPVSLRNEIV
jgi:hypothetical protein